MDTYIINGHEVEFDIFDLTSLELFESERAFAMRRAEEVQNSNDNTVNAVREMCEIVRDFFDVLLGEGTSEKLFGTRRNVMVEMSALTKFLQDVSGVIDRAGTQLFASTPERPRLNRQQRREAERKAEREKRRQEAAQRAATKTAVAAGSASEASFEA